ncbi:MAG: 3'-5' exonuclease [Alistipes indistinctus]
MMSMGTPEGLEEERRLFYVALTRAKRAAVLSFAESRFKWGEMTFGRPSRFLSEIDPRYLDLQFELRAIPATAVRGRTPRARYGRTGALRAAGDPVRALFAGLRTGRLRKKSGCTGYYRRTATQCLPAVTGKEHRDVTADPGVRTIPAGDSLGAPTRPRPAHVSAVSTPGVPRRVLRLRGRQHRDFSHRNRTPGCPTHRSPSGYPPRPIGGAASASPRYEAPRTAPTLPAHPPRRVPATK